MPRVNGHRSFRGSGHLKLPWFGGGILGSVISRKIDRQAPLLVAEHSLEAAIEKLRWYAFRWKIEMFHKILKSGCRAEEARLRAAERLVKLISVFCILS